MKFPHNLLQQLENRKHDNAFRTLSDCSDGVDFVSNDYLGFSRSETIFQQTHDFLKTRNIIQNGATGSRLLSGNHIIYQETEKFIANFHQAESALLFNSGYDANVGFISSICRRGDIILFDELSHASIRDGIMMSNAKAVKFKHNDNRDLKRLLTLFRADTNYNLAIDGGTQQIYIVTESVFSMDGDMPNLTEMLEITTEYGCHIVVDEAHALGVVGVLGRGLIDDLQLQDQIFARIYTFGKGLGCHGAAILGSKNLTDYLINFSRSFIYTTGLSPHAVASILIAYQHIESNNCAVAALKENIIHFNQEKSMLSLKPLFIRSKSAIQCAIVPGNQKVKSVADQLQRQGFNIKAVLSPTVAIGQERLRFCLHSYNTKDEISKVLNALQRLM